MDEEGGNPAVSRPVVLVLTDHYLPGFRHGGPIRSIRNLVSSLGADFDFRILTRDRDVGSGEPYPSVRPGRWQTVEGSPVRYLPPGDVVFGLRRLLRSTRHDVLYLNSYFSPAFSILPLLLRRLHLVPRKAVVIAPRGEFSAGALGIKPLKKRAWNLVAAGLGLHRDALWQATTIEESTQIKGAVGDQVKVLLGPVLARLPQEEGPAISGRDEPKVPGTARVVFFSRISPMKNLGFAVSVVGQSSGRLLFDIYGVIDDKAYWADCRRLISASNDGNVSISYKGELSHEEVTATLSSYDLLLLPSRGENFGHVILEALGSGCPVAISDKTPWGDVQSAGAGWVIPLTDEGRWRAAVETVVNADNETLRRFRSAAVKLARSRSSRGEDVDQNRQLFYTAAGPHPPGIRQWTRVRSRAADSVEPHLKDDQTPDP